MDTDSNCRNQSAILCFLLLYYLAVLFQIIVQLFFYMFLLDVVMMSKLVISHIHDLQFFTVRCYQIVCLGYHETLDVFSPVFRDIWLDDFLELYFILCIDHQIQWMNLIFILSIEKSHLQLLVFVITWYWSLCSAFHVKQLHIHFAIVDVIVGKGISYRRVNHIEQADLAILPSRAVMDQVCLSSHCLNTAFSDLSKACYCFLVN